MGTVRYYPTEAVNNNAGQS